MAMETNTLLLLAALAGGLWYFTQKTSASSAADQIVDTVAATGAAPDPITLKSLLDGMTAKEKITLASKLQEGVNGMSSQMASALVDVGDLALSMAAQSGVLGTETRPLATPAVNGYQGYHGIHRR